MHPRIPRFLVFLSCFSLVVTLSLTKGAPVALALKVDETSEATTFLPFLKRYVTFPKDWRVTVDDARATFRKVVRIETPVPPAASSSSSSSAAPKRRVTAGDRRQVRRNRRLGIVVPSPAPRSPEGDVGSSSEASSESSSASSALSIIVTETSSSFTVGLFPTEQCNVLSLQAMLDQKYPGIKEDGKIINYERIPGAQAAGYSWMEKSGTERHICIIPAGRVYSSEVVIPAADAGTYELVSQTLLQQLVKEVKRTRNR